MLYYVQSSLFGLLLLGIIYFEVRNSNIDRKLNQFLFRVMILVTATLLINEMILNLLNGQMFNNSTFWLTTTIFIFYILNPLPPAIWV
jgi:hypothetical protein